MILGDQESGHGVLHEFLGFERSRSTSFVPKFFEVGFGSKLGAQTRIDETLSSEDPIVAGGVHLRGKVDRIEIGKEAFSILDYKTGKQLPTLEDIRQGISLQLPIYLYTIEKLLTKKLAADLNPAGALYYQVRNPVALKVGVGSGRYKTELEAKVRLLASDQELRTLVDDCITRVNEYVAAIARGTFPLTSADKIEKVCTYCDYKTICRIQAVRRVEKAKED